MLSINKNISAATLILGTLYYFYYLKNFLEIILSRMQLYYKKISIAVASLWILLHLLE